VPSALPWALKVSADFGIDLWQGQALPLPLVVLSSHFGSPPLSRFDFPDARAYNPFTSERCTSVIEVLVGHSKFSLPCVRGYVNAPCPRSSAP
jgi:hypothetical protein